ncbi:MAG: response regulator, partial [Dermatophilaceae bacterium]
GIGISQENMAKLFQAFTQVDSSLARKFEGTGLGLAMVKQMTELLGGSVAVASKEAEGACFAAWVPLRSLDESDSAEGSAVGAVTKAPREMTERVALVVEDNDGAADLVRLLLEAEGFSVLRAATAETALEMAPQQPLSLITLDIGLPGKSGWEFLAGIRQNPVLGDIPVVIISGTSEGQLVALARGAADVLQKPISRSALKASLLGLGFNPVRNVTRTVLVVDDDPKAVELISRFLPAPDYAVVRAYGGAEAIVLAQQVRPDLILLDLMMPDVNGFDVVRALQDDDGTAGIPIVIVTAKAITAMDRTALNADPSKVPHIIEKAGFNRTDFMDEVRRALLRP